MNRERRRKIRSVVKRLGSCANDLSAIKDDEDEARENMPENLQGGEAYCTSEEMSDKIDDALSDMQEAIDTLADI